MEIVFTKVSPRIYNFCVQQFKLFFFILCFHILLQALTAYISLNHNAIQYSIITLSENTVCVFWCNDNILRWGCNMLYRSGLVQAYSIHLINMYIFTGNQSINDATNSSTLWVDITVDIRDNIEEEYPEDTLKRQYRYDT